MKKLPFRYFIWRGFFCRNLYRIFIFILYPNRKEKRKRRDFYGNDA